MTYTAVNVWTKGIRKIVSLDIQERMSVSVFSLSSQLLHHSAMRFGSLSWLSI